MIIIINDYYYYSIKQILNKFFLFQIILLIYYMRLNNIHTTLQYIIFKFYKNKIREMYNKKKKKKLNTI